MRLTGISDKFSELIQNQLNSAKEDYEESVEEKKVIDRINIAVVLIASIISIVLALVIARQIKPSREISRLCRGDSRCLTFPDVHQ